MIDISPEDAVSFILSRHENLKRGSHEAESEADLRQNFLALYDIDHRGKLEKYYVDYVHPELWIEFKLAPHLCEKSSKVKVIAQILHYLHDAIFRRKETSLPESFAIVDRTSIEFYKTDDFVNYIIF